MSDHIITTEQLASGEVVLLTQDQIDAAWEHTDNEPPRSNEALATLAELGIVACEKCGGSGRGETEHAGALGEFEWVCDSCHGHGWVVK